MTTMLQSNSNHNKGGTVFRRYVFILLGFIALARILLFAKALYFALDEDIVYRLKDFLALSEGKTNIHKTIEFFKDYYKILHYKNIFLKLFFVQFVAITAICLWTKARFVFTRINPALAMVLISFVQLLIIHIYFRLSTDIIVNTLLLNTFLIVSNTAILKLPSTVGLAGLALFPFFSEFIMPASFVAVWSAINKHRPELLNRIAFIVAFAITSNFIISAFTFDQYLQNASWEGKKSQAERIVNGDFHGLEIGVKNRNLFAMEIGTSLVYVFDLDDLKLPYRTFKIETGELEHIAINEDKNEIYHFDRNRVRLFVIDADSFLPIRQSPPLKDGQGSAKVAFDNESGTIAVKQEENKLWILNMDDLEPVAPAIEVRNSDVLIFDKTSRKYLLSLFRDNKNFKAISTDGKVLLDVPAAENQQVIATSTRRKEIYLALPLKKQIYVYDAQNMLLKRKIPTVFGVRGVVYDDVNDVLIASSMCTGYVDIIDLKSYESVFRIFVQYYLRGVVANPKKREAIVASTHGLYSFNY